MTKYLFHKVAQKTLRHRCFIGNFTNFFNTLNETPELLFITLEHKAGDVHCVNSVQIQSYFWSVFSCIRIEYRKIRTRNNSVFGHFSRSGLQHEVTEGYLLENIYHKKHYLPKVFSASDKPVPLTL